MTVNTPDDNAMMAFLPYGFAGRCTAGHSERRVLQIERFLFAEHEREDTRRCQGQFLYVFPGSVGDSASNRGPDIQDWHLASPFRAEWTDRRRPFVKRDFNGNGVLGQRHPVGLEARLRDL